MVLLVGKPVALGGLEGLKRIGGAEGVAGLGIQRGLASMRMVLAWHVFIADATVAVLALAYDGHFVWI